MFGKTVLLVSLEFLNQCMAKTLDRDSESPCRQLLRRLVRESCGHTKAKDGAVEQWISGMHPNFRRALFEMEACDYRSVTKKTIGRDRVEKWTPAAHKLCLLHACYSVVCELPCLAGKLLEPALRQECVAAAMLSGSENRVKWSKLLFRSRTSSVDALVKKLLYRLRDVDASPRSTCEHYAAELARSLIQKSAGFHAPLVVTILVGAPELQPAAETLLHDLMSISKGEQVAPSSCAEAVKLLSDEEKRLLKFALLYHRKLRQFSVRYADDGLKCAAPSSGSSSESQRGAEDRWLVFCCYCSELLTYTNIGKRPPSFGPYLQSEAMEMRCYKCDSAELVALPCGDVTRGVSLELSHPDRHPVGFCRGQRRCRNVCAYPSRECSDCWSMRRRLDGGDFAEECFLHEGTCLVSCAGPDSWCPSCRHYWRTDPSLVERLRLAASLKKKGTRTEARSPVRSTSPAPPVEAAVVGSEASRRNFRSACRRAAHAKDRKRLLK